MSHTIRRRHTHNAQQRGQRRDPRRGEKRAAPSMPERVAPAPADASLMATDHAVVRWMTRVVGVDIRRHFIEQLLPPERAKLVARMQSGTLRVHDTNVVLVVRGGVVASVIVQGEGP